LRGANAALTRNGDNGIVRSGHLPTEVLTMKGRLFLFALVAAIGLAVAGLALAQNIKGTRHADTIIGTPSADVIYALGGRDTVDAENGSDRVDGGPGADRLLAGAGDDVVRGAEGADVIYGQGGNDTLRGGEGNDVIWVGRGRDVENGGPGDDQLHALANDNRVDQVDCGDGEAFEVVSAASGVLRVRLIGLVPSAFITQTSKSPSRLDVNAMRVPSGACCSSHVRFSGSAAWPAFRA